jgi:hypothetical protein
MPKLRINRLEKDEGLRELLYHVNGIVEASENVAELTRTLNETYGRDSDAFAETTSLLEVQALEHLGYHVKSMRKPLRRLQRQAYGSLEENGKTAPKRSAKSTRARDLTCCYCAAKRVARVDAWRGAAQLYMARMAQEAPTPATLRRDRSAL